MSGAYISILGSHTGTLYISAYRSKSCCRASVVEKLRAAWVKISTAEVLRLRATSAVSRDQSVRRSAQDDDSVGVLTKNILNKLANQPLRW